MKTSVVARCEFAVIVLVALFSLQEALGQLGQLPAFTYRHLIMTNHVIQTTGGITYFTHTSVVSGACESITSGPVTRSGTDVMQMINDEKVNGLGCVLVIIDPYAETHVSVLGNLPPGDHVLQVYSALSSGVGWSSVVTTNLYLSEPFTVPVETAPTMETSLEANNFKISVPGIPKVLYTVESSSTSTNWSPVFSTNGGPFAWSEPISPGNQQRFYRVRIEGQ